MCGDAICSNIGRLDYSCPMWCYWCGKKTKHFLGYLDSKCSVCGLAWSRPDGEICRVIDFVRKEKNLRYWKDLGVLIGLSASTCRKYYYCMPWRLWDKLFEFKILKAPEVQR